MPKLDVGFKVGLGMGPSSLFESHFRANWGHLDSNINLTDENN